MNDARQPRSGLMAALPMLGAIGVTAALMLVAILIQTIELSPRPLFATGTLAGCLGLVLGIAWLWPTSSDGVTRLRTPGLAVAAFAMIVVAGSAFAFGSTELASEVASGTVVEAKAVAQTGGAIGFDATVLVTTRLVDSCPVANDYGLTRQVTGSFVAR